MAESHLPHEGTFTGKGFRAADLWVDPTGGCIAGPGGTAQVDPKVMDVFVALARRPGRVITREELLDAVWPGNVVTDYVLWR